MTRGKNLNQHARQEMFMVGLHALAAAIEADDPKRELLIRVDDLVREARALSTGERSDG